MTLTGPIGWDAVVDAVGVGSDGAEAFAAWRSVLPTNNSSAARFAGTDWRMAVFCGVF